MIMLTLNTDIFNAIEAKIAVFIEQYSAHHWAGYMSGETHIP